MAKETKKLKAMAGKVDSEKNYGVDEAIALVRSLATAKFDETIEVALNLGVDRVTADQMVRGVVNLPRHGKASRRRLSPAATGRGATSRRQGSCGRYNGSHPGRPSDFARVIATPDMMVSSDVSARCRPQGLMPNPSSCTVHPDVASSSSRQAGQFEFGRKGRISTPASARRASPSRPKPFRRFRRPRQGQAAGTKGKYLQRCAHLEQGARRPLDTAEVTARKPRSIGAIKGARSGPFLVWNYRERPPFPAQQQDEDRMTTPQAHPAAVPEIQSRSPHRTPRLSRRRRAQSHAGLKNKSFDRDNPAVAPTLFPN